MGLDKPRGITWNNHSIGLEIIQGHQQRLRLDGSNPHQMIGTESSIYTQFQPVTNNCHKSCFFCWSQFQSTSFQMVSFLKAGFICGRTGFLSLREWIWKVTRIFDVSISLEEGCQHVVYILYMILWLYVYIYIITIIIITIFIMIVYGDSSNGGSPKPWVSVLKLTSLGWFGGKPTLGTPPISWHSYIYIYILCVYIITYLYTHEKKAQPIGASSPKIGSPTPVVPIKHPWRLGNRLHLLSAPGAADTAGLP